MSCYSFSVSRSFSWSVSHFNPCNPKDSAHQASLSFTGMTGVLLRREDKQTKNLRVYIASKGDHARTQRSGSHLKARKTSLKQNQTCQDLDLGLPAFQTVRRYIFIVKVTQSVAFCYDGLTRQIQ